MHHSSHLHALLAQRHTEDRRREAARSALRRAVHAPPPEDAAADETITIRVALPGDAHLLANLAELDCARVPRDPVLIAEADGQARAAISLSDGAVIADPFHPTAAIRDLLLTRAEQLQTDRPTRPVLVRRVLARASARAR